MTDKEKIEALKTELESLNQKVLTGEIKPVVPMDKRDEDMWVAGFGNAVLRIYSLMFCKN